MRILVTDTLADSGLAILHAASDKTWAATL